MRTGLENRLPLNTILGKLRRIKKEAGRRSPASEYLRLNPEEPQGYLPLVGKGEPGVLPAAGGPASGGAEESSGGPESEGTYSRYWGVYCIGYWAAASLE